MREFGDWLSGYYKRISGHRASTKRAFLCAYDLVWFRLLYFGSYGFIILVLLTLSYSVSTIRVHLNCQLIITHFALDNQSYYCCWHMHYIPTHKCFWSFLSPSPWSILFYGRTRSWIS